MNGSIIVKHIKGGCMKKAILGLFACAFLISLAGCSTVKGLGEDVSTVGGWITKGSEHVEESVQNNPQGSKM